ncbi:MAG TPA: pyruvate, water dikinase regulatory protein, partial [Burkholderiaceae bacterium]|nr:pyruvate, water dikinase regulatory protein [Burkholderiaceae bacterium]
MTNRTVFFVSDGTGITAETFGNSIMSQFAVRSRHVRRPFIDTADKAHQVLREINHAAEAEGRKPIVFITLVNPEILAIMKGRSPGTEQKGMVLDMFNTFIEPLEAELGVTSNHRVGRFADISKSQEYTDRIEAINFSLAHDDGQSAKNLSDADVILVGVSRSGKTPTSLYLAMQHGIKAANYPLIPEDFERSAIPSMLAPYRKKCFGLTIDPERLSHIRNERRPGSKYAALENCR